MQGKRGEHENLRIQDGVCAVLFLPFGHALANVLLYLALLLFTDGPVSFADETLQFWAHILSLPLAAIACITLVRAVAPQRYHDPGPAGVAFCAPRGRWILATAFSFLVLKTVALSVHLYRMSQGEVSPDAVIEQLESLESLERTVLFVSIVTLGPMLEEFVFRGILFAAVAAKFGAAAAVLSTTALFGLIHLPGTDLYGIAQVTALGLAAALLRLHTGSLLPPILLHAAYNLLASAGPYLEMAAQD